MSTLQQPNPETPLTRWSLKVSAEADVDLRVYLAQHGMRKGDLSKFVEQAVRRDLLNRMLDEQSERNASLDAGAIDADINTALREVRGAAQAGLVGAKHS
ncbi:MAG: ribbon-helix-helix domain-containing protein [Casimicrobium sp.]